MSEVTANIIIQPIDTTFVVGENTIDFTPSDISLNLYTTGRQGPQGYTGSIGPPTGYTGSIGALGYTGSKGDPGGYTGSRGTPGIPGAVGLIGPIGYTGSAGSGSGSGYSGSIGAQGPQGPQGPIGYTGSRSTISGPQGPLGYTGSAGSGSGSGNSISNGRSNVSIPAANGNINFVVNTNQLASISSNLTTFGTNVQIDNGNVQINNGYLNVPGNWIYAGELYLTYRKQGESLSLGPVSGTVAVNLSHDHIGYTLGGNTTFLMPVATSGSSIYLHIKQDSVGGRTATFSNVGGTPIVFSDGVRTISTAANAVSVVHIVSPVIAGDLTWYAMMNKNFS